MNNKTDLLNIQTSNAYDYRYFTNNGICVPITNERTNYSSGAVRRIEYWDSINKNTRYFTLNVIERNTDGTRKVYTVTNHIINTILYVYKDKRTNAISNKIVYSTDAGRDDLLFNVNGISNNGNPFNGDVYQTANNNHTTYLYGTSGTNMITDGTNSISNFENFNTATTVTGSVSFRGISTDSDNVMFDVFSDSGFSNSVYGSNGFNPANMSNHLYVITYGIGVLNKNRPYNIKINGNIKTYKVVLCTLTSGNYIMDSIITTNNNSATFNMPSGNNKTIHICFNGGSDFNLKNIEIS